MSGKSFLTTEQKTELAELINTYMAKKELDYKELAEEINKMIRLLKESRLRVISVNPLDIQRWANKINAPTRDRYKILCKFFTGNTGDLLDKDAEKLKATISELSISSAPITNNSTLNDKWRLLKGATYSGFYHCIERDDIGNYLHRVEYHIEEADSDEGRLSGTYMTHAKARLKQPPGKFVMVMSPADMTTFTVFHHQSATVKPMVYSLVSSIDVMYQRDFFYGISTRTHSVDKGRFVSYKVLWVPDTPKEGNVMPFILRGDDVATESWDFLMAYLAKSLQAPAASYIEAGPEAFDTEAGPSGRKLRLYIDAHIERSGGNGFVQMRSEADHSSSGAAAVGASLPEPSQ